jgi:hypothetical protein
LRRHRAGLVGLLPNRGHRQGAQSPQWGATASVSQGTGSPAVLPFLIFAVLVAVVLIVAVVVWYVVDRR